MNARQILRCGCTHGWRVFGDAGGTHTIGGCAFLKERDLIILRRNLMRMGDIARALAAAFPEEPRP